MGRLPYLLIVLSLWAQFDDDLLAQYSDSPSISIAGEDDEYLPVKRDLEQERITAARHSLTDRLEPVQSAIASAPSAGLLFEVSDSDGKIGCCPLYVLMSLQL
jgi:hypothetical protein